ncbi:MAG: hypothetical protein MUF19_00725 [Candidatus Pacebacteria bacterium]|nr:hypothetical protein [Candidatus Paceibacterota bacterium]
MARVPMLSAFDAVAKTSPLVEDKLLPDEIKAVQVVLVFFNKKYGLLLGHIGRHLSLGRNKDLQTHLRDNRLSAAVREEILVLFGLEGEGALATFLQLPTAPQEVQEGVRDVLQSHRLIGKIRLRVPRQQYDRDSYLDS